MGFREGVRPTRGEGLEEESPWTLGRRKALGGMVVDAAREVPKPRTRHAAGQDALRATGPPFRHVSWGKKAQGRKHRPTRGAFGLPGRCGGDAMGL
jgi:hypothetical protein